MLSQTHTDSTADVSSVIEGNLAANMRVVGVILDHYIEASNAAGRGVTSIEEDFGRIITHTAIGEIIVADRTGRVLHSVTSSGGERIITVLYQDELDNLMAENWIDHSGAKIHRGDSSQYKYVTVARPGSDYIVQIGLPLVRGNSASILNTVYQEQADVLVREGYPEALWFNDSDNQIAAAAQYSEADDITEMESAWRMPYYDRSDSAAVLLERASATGQPASYRATRASQF